MTKAKKNADRERRISDEIIVDAYGPEEQAMGWYYYLEKKLHFPFFSTCIAERETSPLPKGDKVEILGMAPEDQCQHEMFVKIRWARHGLAVPLSQLKPTGIALIRTIVAAVIALLAGTLPALAQETGAAMASTVGRPWQQARPEDMQWWREARFGMFVHWGPVSLKGTEIGWSRGDQVPTEVYDQLYREFNPSGFNADDWVSVAKAAGMKYLVFTTKHHDGFCEWDTKFTDYNIMNTPFHRDVVKELAAACRSQGVVFGIYHSICDWHHPDYPLGSPGGKTQKPAPNMERYNAYLKGQLAELIGNYGPFGVLWFDGEWESPWTYERGVDLNNYVRGLQPGILINNRVGKGRAGMAGTTQDPAHPPGDYDTPEQQVGKFQNDRPWESCITICRQWAWRPNDTMKSLKECLRTLITCAGGDGNLLLNIGPMPDGRIEPRQVERLREMGQWLDRYGRTIYATRGGPFKPGPWGASTFTGNTIYLHLFDPNRPRLSLPPIAGTIIGSTVLTGDTVEVGQTPNGITLTLPQASLRDISTIVELRLDGPAADIPPVEVPSESQAAGRSMQASYVIQDMSQYDAHKAVDDDEEPAIPEFRLVMTPSPYHP